MKSLTLKELNKAISKFSRAKMAPYGLNDLMMARDYLLSKHDTMPDKDPREVLAAMGWKLRG
jgi:hypothetical protein